MTALAATLVTVSPAAPAAGDPSAAAFPAYAVFNVPNDAAHRDRSIENEIIRLTDNVPSGSWMRAAMFSWSSVPVAEALRRAAARGVVVRVVLDGRLRTTDSEAMRILRSADLDDLDFCGTSWATVSGSTACVGNYSKSINHNKFFTFSTSGTDKRLVLLTSQNMTYSQNNRFNNAVVIKGDYNLYDHYTRYFNDMRAERKNNDYYHDDADGYHKSPNTAVTSYHSPRAYGDTVRNILTYVRRHEAGCTVEVAQAMFTNPRTPVADQLLRIARLGCKVRIVYSRMGTQVRSILRGSANISMKKYYDGETDNYGGRAITVHSKYLVVKGNYNDKPGRTIVYAGSHNLTGPALRNHDETLIKVEHPTVSAAYRDNFATLWSRAKCVNPPNGSCIY